MINTRLLSRRDIQNTYSSSRTVEGLVVTELFTDLRELLVNAPLLLLLVLASSDLLNEILESEIDES